MRYLENIFLGVTTDDMEAARRTCEALIGKRLKCTHSTFCGGVHCRTSNDEASYDLRLNHHDDGDGWSWCIDNPRYPLVLTCTFYSHDERDRIIGRLGQFGLIEVPKRT